MAGVRVCRLNGSCALQLDELADSYREEVQILQDKKERELEENALSTKLAIDSAKKVRIILVRSDDFRPFRLGDFIQV